MKLLVASLVVLLVAAAFAADPEYPSAKSTPGPDCASQSGCASCTELRHCVWCEEQSKCFDHDANAQQGHCTTATRQCNITKAAADPKENRYKFPQPKIMGRNEYGSSEIIGSTGDLVEADVVGTPSAPAVLKQDKKKKTEVGGIEKKPKVDGQKAETLLSKVKEVMKSLPKAPKDIRGWVRAAVKNAVTEQRAKGAKLDRRDFLKIKLAIARRVNKHLAKGKKFNQPEILTLAQKVAKKAARIKAQLGKLPYKMLSRKAKKVEKEEGKDKKKAKAAVKAALQDKKEALPKDVKKLVKKVLATTVAVQKAVGAPLKAKDAVDVAKKVVKEARKLAGASPAEIKEKLTRVAVKRAEEDVSKKSSKGRIRLAVKLAYRYKWTPELKTCKRKYVVRAVRSALKARRMANPAAKKIKACELLRVAFRMIKVCKKKVPATSSKEERQRILDAAAVKIVAKLTSKKQKKVADAVKAAILDSKTVKVPSAIKREIVKDILSVRKEEKKEGLKVPTKKLVAVTKKVLKQLKKNPNTTRSEIKAVVKKEMDKKASPKLPKPAGKKEKKLVKKVKSDVKAAIASVRGVKVPAAVKAEIIKDVIAIKSADKAAGLKISDSKVVKAVAKAIKKMKKTPELTKEGIRAVVKKELDKKALPKLPKPADKKEKKKNRMARLAVTAAILSVKGIKVTPEVKAELIKDLVAARKNARVAGLKVKFCKMFKAVRKALKKMKKSPNVSKEVIRAVLQKQIDKRVSPKIKAATKEDKKIVKQAKAEVKAAIASVKSVKVTGPVKAELIKDVAAELKNQKAAWGKKPSVSKVIKAVKKALRKMKKSPNVSRSEIKSVISKEISKKAALPIARDPKKLVVHDAVKAAVAKVEATKKVALSRKDKKAIKKAVKKAIKIEAAKGVVLKPKTVMAAAAKVAKVVAKAKTTGLPPTKDLTTVAVKKAEKKIKPGKIMMRSALKAVRAQKMLRNEKVTKGEVKRILSVLKPVVKGNVRRMKATDAVMLVEALFDIAKRTQDDKMLISTARTTLEELLNPKKKAVLDGVKMVNSERKAKGKATLSASTKMEVAKIVANSLSAEQILKPKVVAAVARRAVQALSRTGDRIAVEQAARMAAVKAGRKATRWAPTALLEEAGVAEEQQRQEAAIDDIEVA